MLLLLYARCLIFIGYSHCMWFYQTGHPPFFIGKLPSLVFSMRYYIFSSTISLWMHLLCPLSVLAGINYFHGQLSASSFGIVAYKMVTIVTLRIHVRPLFLYPRESLLGMWFKSTPFFPYTISKSKVVFVPTLLSFPLQLVDLPQSYPVVDPQPEALLLYN